MTDVEATDTAVQRAYDALAPVYDRQLAADLWMRRLLWTHYDAAFQPGDRVLDLGCGTGDDAIHLAWRGVRVTGIDASAGMIAQARAKAERERVAAQITLQTLTLNAITSLQPELFDGIISSFAVLNTVRSLRPLAEDAAQILSPGGRMILHLLNPWCLREWLALVLRGRWSEARSLGHDRERVFMLGDLPVRHYLERGEELYQRHFASSFRLDCIFGLGIVRQTRDHRPYAARSAFVLEWIDSRIGTHEPFVNWGRFVVLEMTRTTSH